MGSPLGLFVTTYFEESFVRDRLPTCDDYYNLYHPSDCIAYRLEPLIRHYDYDVVEEPARRRNRDTEESGNLRMNRNKSTPSAQVGNEDNLLIVKSTDQAKRNKPRIEEEVKEDKK